MIRDLTFADRDALVELHRAVAAQGGGIARELDEVEAAVIDAFLGRSLSEGIALGAFQNGVLIGEIHAARLEPRCFAHVLGHLTIAVDPSSQGRGIGRRVFESLLVRVRDAMPDILRVELWVRESNVRAIGLYESLGFVREGRLQGKVRSASGFDADIPMAWLRPGVAAP